MSEPSQVDELIQERLAALLQHARKTMVAVAIVSAVVNVLLLTGSLYMMLVYDYALPSHNISTLLGLAVIAALLYVLQGVLDYLRGRLLINFGSALDIDLAEDVNALIGELTRLEPSLESLQPVRDLDNLRTFLSGSGPSSLVDLPWMLFFVIVLFLMHPYLGITVLIGGTILVLLTLVTEKLTIEKSKRLTDLNARRLQIAELTKRHAEVLFASGMQPVVTRSWGSASEQFLVEQEQITGVVTSLGTATKVIRMALQSALLTVGVVLVLNRDATAGVIFAGSIIGSRALAPVEGAIANWRGFVSARQSWTRLKTSLAGMRARSGGDVVPLPKRTLDVEKLTVVPPGSSQPTVVDVSFSLNAGTALAVIGPSGGGKSTIVRSLIGYWPARSGSVRLDGAEIGQWKPETIGRSIGYVPQNVELIQGTVAKNIARFRDDASPEAVIAAAKQAGVHDLILQMPDGYNTEVGPDGRFLSGGQRQRVALARALFGDPFLLVLDEPNANLDAAGDEALGAAIVAAKNRGAIVVAVAHRPSILNAVDQILVIGQGRIMDFGPKDEIIPKVTRRPVRPSRPLPDPESGQPAAIA